MAPICDPQGLRRLAPAPPPNTSSHACPLRPANRRAPHVRHRRAALAPTRAAHGAYRRKAETATCPPAA